MSASRKQLKSPHLVSEDAVLPLVGWGTVVRWEGLLENVYKTFVVLSLNANKCNLFTNAYVGELERPKIPRILLYYLLRISNVPPLIKFLGVLATKKKLYLLTSMISCVTLFMGYDFSNVITINNAKKITSINYEYFSFLIIKDTN